MLSSLLCGGRRQGGCTVIPVPPFFREGYSSPLYRVRGVRGVAVSSRCRRQCRVFLGALAVLHLLHGEKSLYFFSVAPTQKVGYFFWQI